MSINFTKLECVKTDERSYLNIHSSFPGGGEIRGFLVQARAVPEPSSLALRALGLAALAFGQRKKLAERAT